MGLGSSQPHQLPVASRLALPEFPQEMLPLSGDLPIGLADSPTHSDSSELPPVEGIAATLRLRVDRAQVPIQRSHRLRMGPEANQLGVVPIPPGVTAEYSAGEQGLPPQGYKADSIEVLRMYGPEPHSRCTFHAPPSRSFLRKT
jgi:hypothetical protein